jgi:hypothetical protein
VSGYLDESVAKDLLLNTARQLFAKEKKLKKPFLMLVEEVHEYIPEGGGLDETGKMLIKIGKRGRKHGLGIVGISQRPADVKKDYITQCDWLVWHRLTWNNDTNVVGRILGSEYADAIEDMGDGEGFLVTDWSGEVRRVQFHRKETFDAGATPGLEDFERPELKSVSPDLVGELREISEERERRESELADLRQKLDRKRQRIDELERELEDARDLSQMADQFAQAMLSKASVSYRGGRAANGEASADRLAIDDGGRTSAEEATQTTLDRDGRTAGTDDGEATADGEGAVDGETATDDQRTTDSETTTDGDPRVRRGSGTRPDDRAVDAAAVGAEPGTREAVVESLSERVESLASVETEMLRYYRDVRLADPVAAHVAAGGDADETIAYGRNRTLREAGLVEHAGRGRYRYAVPERILEACGDELDESTFVETVGTVEERFLDRDPSEERAAGDPERSESERR